MKAKIKTAVFIIAVIAMFIGMLTGAVFLYAWRPNLELNTISLEENNIYRAYAGYFYGHIYVKTDEDISDYLYDKHYDEDIKLKASGRVVGYRTASHDCWGVGMWYLAPVIELYEVNV